MDHEMSPAGEGQRKKNSKKKIKIREVKSGFAWDDVCLTPARAPFPPLPGALLEICLV